MHRALDRIGRWLRDGGLRGMPAPGEETSLVLDLRDADPFDGAWVRANDEVQSRIRAEPLDPEMDRLISVLAREAFLACGNNRALAPYVSDDFRLIAQSLAVRSDSPWIAGLFETYALGAFPAGTIAPSASSTSDIAAALSHRTVRS